MPEPIITFSPDGLIALNIILGLIMFGIALELKWADFISLRQFPLSFLVGIIGQFVLLPLITVLIVLLGTPSPGIALGMILVAACPGGNVSNMLTKVSGGNVALSIGLTAFATLFAVFATPLNTALYVHLYPPVSELYREFNLSFFDLFRSVALILLLPLLLGMFFHSRYTAFSNKLSGIFKPLSFLALALFIVFAFVANRAVFLSRLNEVITWVFVQNFVAFLLAFLLGKLCRLPSPDIKSVTIETGIQNSGLALVLIFTFFDGNQEMALVAACWGVWHLISGTAVALFFKKLM